MTQQIATLHQNCDVIDVPLNKLKASPRNAERTPHAEADIETLAASITVKGVLREPEVDAAGTPTSSYLVSIDEGARSSRRAISSAAWGPHQRSPRDQPGRERHPRGSAPSTQ